MLCYDYRRKQQEGDTVNRIDLTQAEWQLMEKLWDHAPQTGRELTEPLDDADASAAADGEGGGAL